MNIPQKVIAAIATAILLALIVLYGSPMGLYGSPTEKLEEFILGGLFVLILSAGLLILFADRPKR